MCGNIHELPKMFLALVPDVATDREDGGTESAGPRVVVDVAVSGRQEMDALGVGEIALSGTLAHAAVHPVYLFKLQGRTGPILEDVLTSMEVRFAFLG